MWKIVGCSAFLFLCTQTAQAAVVIHEVAWMGGEDSANDEWIELYNDEPSSVSVDGWVLSDGMGLEVALAGAVGAGQYAVLERTDDNSAPGSAFLIYTGALTNGGATLSLRRTDGSLEDQVAGGENWENIGGDNTTKETAQLTSGGWVTGAPTPGKQNVTTGTPQETEEEDNKVASSNQTRSSSSGNSKQKTILSLPDVDLELEIVAPELVYVNQPVSFSVEPSGIGEVAMDSLRYQWNFGDTYEEEGNEVQHTYRYPGTYVVSVRGEFSYHEQTARREITVLPVSFSLTRNQAGDVQINNDAPYEIDLSGFTIKGTKSVTLPERSFLLPNGTITIDKDRLEDRRHSMVMLYDQADVVVASTYSGIREALASSQPLKTLVVEETLSPTPLPLAQALVPTAPTDSFSFNNQEKIPSKEPQDDVANSADFDDVALVSAATATDSLPLEWPYMALIGLLTISILGLFAGKHRNE
ncbi:MAG: lamin tail domain-containing protein [Patescibacteria group bacterium]